ncbi:MAG: hypothetical protein V3V12_03370 [Gammaproteobacteria bacterium]
MHPRMILASLSGVLQLGVVVLSLSLTACGGGSSSDSNASSGSTDGVTTASALVLYPESADIKTSETAQFEAFVVGEQDAAIEWAYEGCGWIEKETGHYHAPTGISGGREKCQATLTAYSLDNPEIKAVAMVKVAAVAVEPEPVRETPVEAEPVNRVSVITAPEIVTPTPVTPTPVTPTPVTPTPEESNQPVPVAAPITLNVLPKAPVINTGSQLHFNVSITSGGVSWSMKGCGRILPVDKTYKAPTELSSEQCRALITFTSNDDPALVRQVVVTVNNPNFTGTTVVSEIAEVPEVNSDDSLVVYPAINQFRSARFSITAYQNGETKNSFVYTSKNADRKSFDYQNGYMQEANHWSTFSFEGGIKVTAKRLDGKAIQSCVIRPLSFGIKPIINQNTCQFRLTKPVNVSVEIDENFTKTINNKNTGGAVTKYVVKHPLFIFANPLEKDVPKKGAANTHYFGPGIHEIGENFPLKNGDIVYVAGGGYVKGTFKNVQKYVNIKFSGRGIISGLGIPKQGGYSHHLLHISGGSKSKLSIEGLTFTDSPRAGIETNAGAHINRVKVFSWFNGSDGVRTGRGSIIENSFFKVNDDVIKLYTGGQIVRDTVIWQMTKGAAFQFGWQTATNVKNIRVTNIDVIHSDAFTDYSDQEKKDNQPDYRSSKAVFSCMGLRNSEVGNVQFTNIRIEDRGLLRLLGMRLASYGPKKRWWGDIRPDTKKIINGITFKNIYLASAPYRQSFLYGNKGGVIKNIRFENLVVEGVRARGSWDLTSKIDGSGFTTLEQVSDISYK